MVAHKNSQNKETYSAEKIGNHCMKFRHNTEYVARARADGYHLILDSIDSQTAHFLRRAGAINKDKIHSPNSDPDVVARQVANGVSTPSHCTIGKHIDTVQCVYDSTWLDYCGSWKGNKSKKFDMKKDIRTFFKRQLFVKKNGVFAVTISMHGAKGILKNRAKTITNAIIKMGKVGGYTLENKITEFYGKSNGDTEMNQYTTNSSSMLFLLFEN